MKPSQVRYLHTQLVEALDLLTFLDEHSTALAQTQQGDLDRWVAHRRTCGNPDRGFLTWAMNTHQMPRLRIPSGSSRPGAPTAPPMTQQARMDAIRRLASDTASPLRTRVAGALVLLYAQPVARIVRLRVEDITTAGEQMVLRIGDPPVPVPPPIYKLIGEYLSHRPNLNTAANPETGCPWLFPGRRPGQPMHPATMVASLRQAGITPGAARHRAVRDRPRHPDPSTSRGQRPELPPSQHRPDRHPDRQPLERIRRRRPHPIAPTGLPGNHLLRHVLFRVPTPPRAGPS